MKRDRKGVIKSWRRKRGQEERKRISSDIVLVFDDTLWLNSEGSEYVQASDWRYGLWNW